MVIITSSRELTAGDRQGRQSEGAAGGGGLALDPNIPQPSATSQFFKVSKKAERRAVHGVFEQDGSRTIKIMFA
jgi:hypothetical protein